MKRIRNKKLHNAKNQNGAVLIIALVFLAMTAVISSSVLNTSVLEVKMVGNAQFKEEAFQISEGILDAIVADYTNNLPVVGDIGFTLCNQGNTSGSCNQSTMSLPSNVTAVTTGVSLTYKVTRLGPLIGAMPIRLGEKDATSADEFAVAMFETNAIYDGRDAKLGHQEVYEGIAVRFPNNQ